jgi:hypothetical protein
LACAFDPSRGLACHFFRSATRSAGNHFSHRTHFSAHFRTNLIAYLVLGLVFLVIRRATLGRKAAAASSKSQPAESLSDATLRQTVEFFLAAADSADVERLAVAYAPDFLCVRVADAGGFAQLTAEQMLSFLRHRYFGHSH